MSYFSNEELELWYFLVQDRSRVPRGCHRAVLRNQQNLLQSLRQMETADKKQDNTGTDYRLTERQQDEIGLPSVDFRGTALDMDSSGRSSQPRFLLCQYRSKPVKSHWFSVYESMPYILKKPQFRTLYRVPWRYWRHRSPLSSLATYPFKVRTFFILERYHISCLNE